MAGLLVMQLLNYGRCKSNPKAPSLQFVNDRENIGQYLRDLSEAKMKKRTQQNYLKSLKRFSVFLTVQTNLRNEDLPLHKECQHFIAFNDSLQHILAKHSKKEITQKRHSMLIDVLSTKNCLVVLEAAKKEFLAVIGKLSDSSSDTLESVQNIFVVYYLEAVVHLQPPTTGRGGAHDCQGVAFQEKM